MTLNENLLPINSPIADNQGQISSFVFDEQNEAGVINSAKIKNASITTAKINDLAVTNAKIESINFSKGTGGTLTLGGTANGNGVMIIRDSSGAAILEGNNLGHHYYGTSGTELIKMDWIGFHAYGTSGTETVIVDISGLHIYTNSGSEVVTLDNSGYTAYGSVGTRYRKSGEVGNSGIAGITSSGEYILAAVNNNKLSITALQGNVEITASGTVALFGTAITINGTPKTAIVSTKKGYKALYTNESPEVWFMDFCETKDKIDPMFLEVTSPPYHFIKCDGGEYQVWGKRKGMEKLRFEEKTKKEFEANNQFWSMPQRMGK